MRMRTMVGGIVLSMTVMSGMVGCGLQPGRTTISFSGGKTPPPPMEADETARYALFASNSGNALYSMELKKGDQYGFKKAADGSIVGFARDREIPLTGTFTSGYYWKMQAK